MAYVKTDWVAREGENLEKFTKYNETANTFVLVNTPDEVTVPGTELSPGNMNHIEQGIFDAHELVASETLERQTDVQSLQMEDQSLLSALGEEVQAREDLQEALGEEVQARQDADEALQEQINAFQDISDALEGGSFTELFAAKQNKITATGSGNLLTAPTAPGGQPGTVAVSELAPIDSPEFVGIPKVPNKTTAASNDGTLIASEAQVALKANILNPSFEGIPTVPSKTTAASSSYPARIATEAQVALKADKNAAILHNEGSGIVCGNFNLNSLRTRGFYAGNFFDAPPAVCSMNGWCIVQESDTAYVSQLFVRRDTGDIYLRTSSSASQWNAWKTPAFTDSPAFTGTPTVNGNLIATTAQVALKANRADPTFAGAVRIESPSSNNEGGRVNRVAVVALTTNVNETSFPIGSYILAKVSGQRNTAAAIYLGSGGHDYTGSGSSVVFGTWLSCGDGSYGILYRRVA